MSLTPREKAADRALTKLSNYLIQRMSPDIRHELYAREILTWHEREQIASAAKHRASEANEEILVALRRRGPEGLDILVEALQEEEANKALIAKIREVWPQTVFPEPRPEGLGIGPVVPLPVPAEENKREFLGKGEWPREFMPSEPLQNPPSIPLPPTEGTDAPKKDVYKMSSRPRGIGLVINNKHFTCGMKDRVGTDKDADALVRLFIHLGFYTNRFDDLKGKDMRQTLKNVADLDHSRFDCLMVAILTHGVSGQLYSTNGDLLAVDEITAYFDGTNCQSLIGKPKVFILQACRGGRFDYGVEELLSNTTDGGPTESTDGEGDTPTSGPPALSEEVAREIVEKEYDTIVEKALDADETDGGNYRGALPNEADFVLAYATVPGYVSWRNSEYGSWFVKALVDTMFELASKEHLMDILTEVNRRVAEEFQSKGRNKQIPAPVSMLRRKLYFRPGAYK